MTRSQKASALFGFLAALDALLTALDFLGYVEIGLNRIDFVVSLVSIPLALAVSFGLWGKRLWGWRLGVAYVAFCLVDGLRGTVWILKPGSRQWPRPDSSACSSRASCG